MSFGMPSCATCGLCSELYTDPRMLQCLHSFCSKCLIRIAKEQESETSPMCPTCQRTVPLPEGGVHAIQKDLRKNYEADVARFVSWIHSDEEKCCNMCIDSSAGHAVSYCLNCNDFLCKTCSDYHKKCRKTLDHDLKPVSGLKSKAIEVTDIPHKPVSCQLHEDEILKFFCVTCSSLICRDCMAIEHTGHICNRIEKVAEKEKASLQSILTSTDTDGIKVKLDNAVSKGNKVMQQVKIKEKSVAELLENAFSTLMDVVLKRKMVLLAKVSNIKADMAVQGKRFKTLRKEIVETYEMITAALQAYTPAEMLSAKGAMMKKLKQLLEEYDNVTSEPCKSDMVSSNFDTSELLNCISSFGLVVAGSSPEKAETDFCMCRAAVKKERKVTITTYDLHGKRFPYGGERVEVKLTTDNYQNNVEGQIVDNDDGTYVASFTPNYRGEHKLSITLDGQQIKGSPFVVHVSYSRDYMQLSPNSFINNIPNPHGVAVDDNGEIYVASYTRGTVEVFSNDGYQRVHLRVVPKNGTSYLKCPTAIAVKENVLYVAEEQNHQIQRFATSGEFMSKFGTQGSGDGELNQPRGLCIHNDGRVFVSDAGNKRISVFDAYGTFLYHIPNDSGHSNFSSPWGIALDHHGSLHIGDSSSIQVFTSEGKYISEYNSHICSPAGIAIDAEGSTLLADSDYYPSYRDGAREWSVSNSKHQVVHSLKNPSCTGITIDKNGVIYLSNYEESKVYIY